MRWTENGSVLRELQQIFSPSPPHPALRATFPRRVKASAAVEKFPAKAQTFRARQFRPLRRSRASSPKGGAEPLGSLLKH